MIWYEASDVEKAEVQQTSSTTSAPDHLHPSPDAGPGKMHPMMRIMQEKELGKFLLASAIAIVGIVVAGRDGLAQSEISFVLILVCLGFTAILYGILLKETFPKLAQIVEPLGIALVAVSFFAIVAFFMPVEFLWVPALCIALFCLLSFFILVWPPATG